MAENRERLRLRTRISRGMRDAGSGIQFLVAVIAVLLVGVIMAVAVDLATPNGPTSNDPNKEPDPNWCNGCVLAAPPDIHFPASD